MYELDCPICLNSFTSEDIRSLPCGHTYCSSCTEKLTNEAPACPECRDKFESKDVRRVFIKPSTSNNGSGSQTTSTRESPVDQEGFIKQANHIARRLRQLNAETPARSVIVAADVIEQVATIQCKKAQEIVWEAVREFWLRLVDDLEELNVLRDLQDQISDLRQYSDLVNERCSKLLQEIKVYDSRIQHLADILEDKTRETERLTVALRKAEVEAEEERDSQRVLVARLRASDMKHRAELKQLKRELKSRKAKAGTRTPQLEEESLIIEPGEAYSEARSHRLDIYNENSPVPKRCKLSPEVSASADSFNNLSPPGDLSDHCPSKFASSPPEMQVQPRERTGPTHESDRAESDIVQPSPQRPKFGSDWNFSRQKQGRKPTGKSNAATLPFPLDAQGRPKSLLKCGPSSRIRMKKAR